MHHRLFLFDCDGVLLDESHRAHFATAKLWGAYFDEDLMSRDGFFPQGRALYEAALMLGDVGYLTARGEAVRRVTERTLARHRFDPTLPLIMRGEAHRSRDGWHAARLKAAIVAELTHVYDEVFLFDDDPSIIAAVTTVPRARARHCTWYNKPKSMVRTGVA